VTSLGLAPHRRKGEKITTGAAYSHARRLSLAERSVDGGMAILTEYAGFQPPSGGAGEEQAGSEENG